MKLRRGVIKNCLYCDGEFYVKQSRKDQQCCNQEHTILLAKSKSFKFNCIICNKEVPAAPSQIKYRNRRHCSRVCTAVTKRIDAEERRKTYTKHQLDRLARNSNEAIQWRKAVFARDDYTCQFCGVRGAALEADHIKPFAYFPELRYDLFNGRTLCRPCHFTTKVSYKALREIWLS